MLSQGFLKKAGVLQTLFFALNSSAVLNAQTSRLWGSAGELWTPQSRLPDFSYAGYHSSEVPLPTLPVTHNVRDFGARGDGVTDDTAAFINAIAAMPSGVLFVPAGRYLLTKVIRIAKSNIVVRGAGPQNTVLFFSKSLTDAVGPGDVYAPGGSWSWSGAFITVNGNNREETAGTVAAPALRGDKRLTLASAAALTVGQHVRLVMTDSNLTLGRLLHADQVDAGPLLLNLKLVDFSFKIESISGNTITFDRPLRHDVRLQWTPQIVTDRPTVEEVGIENLAIEFPLTAAAPHHEEPGHNAIEFETVRNSWIKNIWIRNADLSITLRARTKFCTVDGVRLYWDAGRAVNGWWVGHHGFQLADLAQDNIVQNFRIDGRLIHDLSVTSLASGNVFQKGSGVDLSFDHHRKAPNENLFTEITGGNGTDIWYSGGDDDAGPPSGARETFWNVHVSAPQPVVSWAVQFNLVGLTTNAPENLSTTYNWVEPITSLEPINLFQAQLDHRLGRSSPKPTPTPPQTDPNGNSAPSLTASPNPWVSTQNSGQQIKIFPVQSDSIVRLFTRLGEPVRTIVASGGEAVWDLLNDQGHRVSTGIYIYEASGLSNGPVRGRIVVIR